MAATPSSHLLNLKVKLQTTDTREVPTTNALLNCNATSLFIDMEYVCKNQLTVHNLAHSILVYNVDRSPNEAGTLNGIVDLVLCYNGYTKCTLFAVTSLGKQNLILGYTWLHEHNPKVDWQTNKVKMSHCPTKCHTCTNEEKVEQCEQHTEAHHIQVCCTGPISSMDNDMSNVPDLDPDDDDDNNPIDENECTIEEGNCIFVVQLSGKAEDICAMQNISAHLAEVFHKNSKPKSS